MICLVTNEYEAKFDDIETWWFKKTQKVWLDGKRNDGKSDLSFGDFENLLKKNDIGWWSNYSLRSLTNRPLSKPLWNFKKICNAWGTRGFSLEICTNSVKRNVEGPKIEKFSSLNFWTVPFYNIKKNQLEIYWINLTLYDTHDLILMWIHTIQIA